MDAGTISVSIGDARFSTCLVLPRSHELVRHLQSLLPATNKSPIFQSEHLQYEYAPASRYQLSTFRQAHVLEGPASPPQATMVTPPPPQVTMAMPSRRQDLQSSTETIQSLQRRRTSPLGETAVRRSRSVHQASSTVHASSSGRKKRCQVRDCGKISVSHGLCRAHGGGRRCQVDGCVKSAQSRGDVCWSHGGGHRCEVPDCMRSRKTKRFCNAHATKAAETSSQSFPRRALPGVPIAHTDPAPPQPAPRFVAVPRLPSLHQALQPYGCHPSSSLSFSGSRQRGSITNFNCYDSDREHVEQHQWECANASSTCIPP